MQQHSNIVFTEIWAFEKEKKKILYEKINGTVEWNKGAVFTKNPITQIISVMFCMGATFVNKNSCLIARIVPFDTILIL